MNRENSNAPKKKPQLITPSVLAKMTNCLADTEFYKLLVKVFNEREKVDISIKVERLRKMYILIGVGKND